MIKLPKLEDVRNLTIKVPIACQVYPDALMTQSKMYAIGHADILEKGVPIGKVCVGLGGQTQVWIGTELAFTIQPLEIFRAVKSAIEEPKCLRGS